MAGNLEGALTELQASGTEWLEDLKSFLRFPSVAVDPTRRDDIEAAVKWLEQHLCKVGFSTVDRLETEGLPVILAGIQPPAAGAPTVLVYGHYDVQPPDPVEEWASPPFEPSCTGEYLFARGAADMKGQLMVVLSALHAWHLAGGCPVGVKVLLEGEEELGSPALGRLVVENEERLKADIALNLDAGMIARDIPTITTALRGAMLFDLEIQGSDRDLHSGIFGGLVTNPIHVLCRLLSGLQDHAGMLTLPGVYDRVRTLDHVDRSGGDLSEEVLFTQVGVAGLEGEQEYSPFERTTIRPSLDVLEIRGGAPRTAIPSRAAASISMRTVPDQDPEELHELMMSYIDSEIPDGVRWDLRWKVGIPPVEVDGMSEGNRAMARAMKHVWGREPEFLPGGGTIPVVPMLQEILGIETVLTGFSLPDDSMHGPDERVHLPTLEKGRRTLVHFFAELGSSSSS